MPIEFNCPQCNRQLRVPDSTAGKMARCPGCQSINKIPDASVNPGLGSFGAAPASGNNPFGDSTNPGSFGQSSVGLSSFDQPIAPAAPPSTSNVPPQPAPPAWMPNAGAFSPVGPVPSGGSPIAGNPFADGAGGMEAKPAGSGSSFGGPNINPYASPTGTLGTHQVPAFAGGGQGLPWDLENSAGSWFETLKLILFEMNDAFRRMKPTGGYLGPLGFYIVCTIISMTFHMIWQAGVAVLQGEDVATAMMVFGIFFAASVIFAPIVCSLSAAFLHGSLMVVGGANLGYETTFRLTAYSWGAMNIVGMIPCVGGCVVLVWGLACLINALIEAQRCTTGQAVGAVVISFLAYLMIVVGIVVAVVGLVAVAAGK